MPDVLAPLAVLRDTAGSFFGHARSCKKSLGDCLQCGRILAWYEALPLGTLAQVLEDRSAPKR